MGVEIILTVLSTAVSAIGQLSAGAAANSAAQFNAQVALNNAAAARAAAAEDARRLRRQGRKRQGTLRSLGLSLDLLEDAAGQEELNVQTRLHTGEAQAAGFMNTANLERARAGSATTAAGFGAASSIFLGGLDIAEAGGFNFASAGGVGSVLSLGNSAGSNTVRRG